MKFVSTKSDLEHMFSTRHKPSRSLSRPSQTSGFDNCVELQVWLQEKREITMRQTFAHRDSLKHSHLLVPAILKSNAKSPVPHLVCCSTAIVFNPSTRKKGDELFNRTAWDSQFVHPLLDTAWEINGTKVK